MNICFNLQFLQQIMSTDLLTYLALFLAYFAYAWSVNRDLNAWESLFLSFKNDIESQKAWMGTEYFEETYKDKNSFNPYKIILPLSFESLPEIIRRGVSELPWISKEFVKQFSLFNERIIAFNNLLSHVEKAIASNPVLTERLKDKLNDLGLDKESVEFDEFKKKIFEAKKTDPDFYLAEQVRRFNRIIHVDLIGNKNKKDKLHFLYCEISQSLDDILNNFNKKRPIFIRYKWAFVLVSIPLFIIIELFFRTTLLQ